MCEKALKIPVTASSSVTESPVWPDCTLTVLTCSRKVTQTEAGSSSASVREGTHSAWHCTPVPLLARLGFRFHDVPSCCPFRQTLWRVQMTSRSTRVQKPLLKRLEGLAWETIKRCLLDTCYQVTLICQVKKFKYGVFKN